MGKLITHALILIATVFLSFLVSKSALREYDFQVIAGLFIILYIKKRFLPKITGKYRGESKLLESVVFTLVVLIIINTTGGTSSNYFFLIYFLLFSLSLILEPLMSFVVSLALIIFFLLDTPKTTNLEYYIPIFALAFLTPFAIFIGEEYVRNLKLESGSLKREKDVFLFLSLIVKNHLKNIKKAVENFTGDRELSQIRKSAHEMDRQIDKFEKEN